MTRTPTPTIDRWRAGFRLIRAIADEIELRELAECGAADDRHRVATISPTLASQIWPRQQEQGS